MGYNRRSKVYEKEGVPERLITKPPASAPERGQLWRLGSPFRERDSSCHGFHRGRRLFAEGCRGSPPNAESRTQPQNATWLAGDQGGSARRWPPPGRSGRSCPASSQRTTRSSTPNSHSQALPPALANSARDKSN